MHSSQQILSVGPRPPATQSAAALLDSTIDVFRCCPPIENLLDGGLRRGHILELLGPPGTPKAAPVLEIIKDFIENREDVLIIGIHARILQFVCYPTYRRVLDPQNAIAPGVIDEKLQRETISIRHLEPGHTVTPPFGQFLHPFQKIIRVTYISWVYLKWPN